MPAAAAAAAAPRPPVALGRLAAQHANTWEGNHFVESHVPKFILMELGQMLLTMTLMNFRSFWYIIPPSFS